MFNHLSIGTQDLAKAIEFYDEVLSVFAIERSYLGSASAAYGQSYQFWVTLPIDGSATAANGSHVAFNADSKQAVDDFYRIAISKGALCEGPPGDRSQYDANYYAAFVRDLDGHKIEAGYWPQDSKD